MRRGFWKMRLGRITASIGRRLGFNVMVFRGSVGALDGPRGRRRARRLLRNRIAIDRRPYGMEFLAWWEANWQVETSPLKR